MSRRTFLSFVTSLLPVSLFMPFSPGFAERNKPAPTQAGKVVGLFDENGVTRLPLAFSFLEGTLPVVTASPTGGYFTVSKFEAGALDHLVGYVSAQGEPNTPCAFNWTAVG